MGRIKQRSPGGFGGPPKSQEKRMIPMKTTESIGVIGRDAMTKGEVKRLRKDGMVPASISIR